MAEEGQALIGEGGTDAPSLPEQLQEHCRRHGCKWAAACCCLLAVALPLTVFLAAAVHGALSPTPPTVPGLVLRKLLKPYMATLPQEYPADAFASPGAGQDLPAEATPYNVCLKPEGGEGRLPDAGEIFEKVFARRAFVEEPFGFNLLHCSFVNFFLEDFFRTMRGTNGSWVNRGTSLLSQVYGANEDREKALRALSSGKVRMGEDGRLLHWKDLVSEHPGLALRCHHLPGYEHNEACLERSEAWYACGDPRCNTHPGFIFWSTVFMLHHNFICDLVAKAHPEMADEELFQAARRINQWTLFKIVWEEYVFKMTCGKTVCSVPFDPEVLRSLDYTHFAASHKTLGAESIPLEFNQLYQWHFWIPDDVWWEDGGGNSTNFSEMMWNPDAFKARSLQSWADAFKRTPMGHIQPRNYPVWMKPSFLKFLEFSRANRLPPYNKYREFFNLPPYTSWDEFNAGPEVTEELKRLYGDDIDRVEFQVGLWADHAPDPRYTKLGLIHPLAKSLKTFVGTFAVTYILNTPMVRDADFLMPETLKPEVVDYARGINFENFLENSGIHGLGSTPNEVPGAWRPPAFKVAMLHGIMGLVDFYR